MVLRSLRGFCLGITLSLAGLTATAAYIYDESKLSPDKRAAYLQIRSSLDSRKGGFERLQPISEAADAFIKDNPDFLPMYVEKARALIIIGWHAGESVAYNRRALQIMEDVQRKAPMYAKSYVLAGHIYTNLQDYENAARSLQRADKLNSTDPWLYLNWSELYGRTKQYDKAVGMAHKGLMVSGQNLKALVSAISAISRFSRDADAPGGIEKIVDRVFTTIQDPLDRLEVADSLIASYNGRSSDLEIARTIIARQQDETPERMETRLSMADLMLSYGFRVVKDQVHLYDKHYSSLADKLLESVPWTESTKERIFRDRFAIALSENDVKRAEDLIQLANDRGVALKHIQSSKAQILWLRRDYAGVIEIYESLSKDDPSYSYAQILSYAYLHTGKVDRFLKLRKSVVDREPTNAWANGNYAQTLLFVAEDFDGAITYGERALDLMPYPIARNITALAYLVKAATYKEAGNSTKSQEYLRRAQALKFDEDYIDRNCRQYCPKIQNLRSMGGRAYRSERL